MRFSPRRKRKGNEGLLSLTFPHKPLHIIYERKVIRYNAPKMKDELQKKNYLTSPKTPYDNELV